MFTFDQALEIDYFSHIAFVAIGLIILSLASMKLPGVRFLPSKVNLKVFALISSVFIAIQLGTTQFGTQALGTEISRNGLLPVVLLIVFEGVVVGWTEEFLFRGCIQRVLDVKFPGITRIRLKFGTIYASLIFGAVHLINIALGQALGATLAQVSFAIFFGLVVGWFYERRNDLSGAAWIHNINDFLATIIPYI